MGFIKSFFRALKDSPKESVSFFHEFHKPPYGGGNQFLLALKNELELRSMRVRTNTIRTDDIACLINSYNFDFSRVERAKARHPKLRVIHRVDGPIGVYRGRDDEVDSRIVSLNAKIANATILQSYYSLQKHQELGFSFVHPVVIPNAADPLIFHPPVLYPSAHRNNKIKIIATAWSDNPRKGGPLYQWLDENLDLSRFEFFFVGRCPVVLKNSRHIAPLPSKELADLLRTCDIYLTASMDDPCSNSLIEALSCGLPVVYRNSGGHPELAGGAGVGFEDEDGCLKAIDAVADNYEQYKSKIAVLSIKDVTEKYLAVLRGDPL